MATSGHSWRTRAKPIAVLLAAAATAAGLPACETSEGVEKDVRKGTEDARDDVRRAKDQAEREAREAQKQIEEPGGGPGY